MLGSTTTCSLGSLRVIKELTAANNEVLFLAFSWSHTLYNSAA